MRSRLPALLALRLLAACAGPSVTGPDDGSACCTPPDGNGGPDTKP